MEMVKVKTAELIGLQLDWAVAKAVGKEDIGIVAGTVIARNEKGSGPTHGPFAPSRSWAHGGPIIEREQISLGGGNLDGSWDAEMYDLSTDVGASASGPTPLVAAMLTYVLFKLGDEVEVPEVPA
jgi:hypothetical protein